MKKQLFLASSILLSGMIAAQVSKRTSHIPLNISNQSMPCIDVLKSDETAVPSNYKPKEAKPLAAKEKDLKTSALTTGVIGTTFYDLQSNGSVGDRIVVNTDGTIAACWTFAGSYTPTYPDRGTGYNYFNGTTWNPAPTARIESARVGWGNVVNTKSGKELILAHNGTNSPLNSRPVKGTGAFTQNTTAIPSATTVANMWPRMVSSGDTVYAISINDISVTPPGQYQGVIGAICFSRSKDGGSTWDKTNIVPAGLDSSHYLSHGGDSYAIAAKGATVVIAAGGNGKDLVLSKSVDAGVTWTYKVVLRFPIKKWNAATMITDITGDGVADIVDSNDGSISVGLDKNNEAYVFYGFMRIKSADVLTPKGLFSYYPTTDGLMMWKESFKADTDTGGILVAQIQDLHQKGVIYFPTADPAIPQSLSFGRWQCSLTSHPSVAFDNNNTMYLTYSSIVDSLISVVNPTKLVRHVYIKKSTDGGINWTYPCDLVETPNGIPYEGMFSLLAKRVDGNVHLIYQRDLAPGSGVPPPSGVNNDQAENQASLNGSNDIVYIKIPVGDISCTEISANGINELYSSISSLNFYPSPASTNGIIDVVLHDNAKMEIVILNSVGQTVYSTSVAGVVGGNKVDVNLSNLNSGLYFYQVRVANSKSITKKFVIEK